MKVVSLKKISKQLVNFKTCCAIGITGNIIMKIIDLTLPAFAFLDAHTSDKDELEGRNVILHLRTASVIEIFDREDVVLNEDVLTYRFSYTNSLGIKEPMAAALHYCATLGKDNDRNLIKEKIMKPAAMWYCDYCAWEDNNILKNIFDGE